MPTSPRGAPPSPPLLTRLFKHLIQRRGGESPCSPQSSLYRNLLWIASGLGLTTWNARLTFTASSHEGSLFSCNQKSGAGLPPGSGPPRCQCPLRPTGSAVWSSSSGGSSQSGKMIAAPAGLRPAFPGARRQRPVEPGPFYQEHSAAFPCHASASPARRGLRGHPSLRGNLGWLCPGAGTAGQRLSR